MRNKRALFNLLPILFGFFVMGFIDIVNISTNYIKQDFGLSHTLSNLLPMAVFFWFAIISIPAGILMGKIGRKNTVLLSFIVTAVGMLLPLADYTMPVVMTAFILLGIGNTILQVSLNPLLIDVVPSEQLTSNLTLGQFIKAICSTLGPILVGFAAVKLENWKIIFPFYAFITVISFVWLYFSSTLNTKSDKDKQPTFATTFSLLRNKVIFLYFLVIILLVGFEIGFVTTIPRFLQERFDYSLEVSGLFCSWYYVARTIGTFFGAIILSKVDVRRFQIVTLSIAILSFVLLMTVSNEFVLHGCTFLIGFCCSNVFAVIFGMAMQYKRDKVNEISSLMITGVAGGALIPPLMGVIADQTNHTMSMILPCLCLVFILIVSVMLNPNTERRNLNKSSDNKIFKSAEV